ncbi:glycosyl transferase family 2 [Leptolyngbya sp. 'hensonii']|uniref:glycosyltransferase n=1 Tax=Leptolyngbya sp. 'hensonii' TaxID=1922337 RepID=UPI00094FBA90|nr:glycosyltransferase [Leptolyngbya sp. 'hensonii']OLP17659.1 glycosyl transferase family 2 [Leptolyngbya sp. 'hensonii']
MGIGLGLAMLSVMIWVWLLAFRGQFWRTDQMLEATSPLPDPWPSICAIVPARNEAELLPITLRSLLSQSYPGDFSVFLIDDHSHDGTGEVARQVAQSLNRSDQLTVLAAEPLPPGWTGKLWALEQGVRRAQTLPSPPDYLLLTDADIQHDSENLQHLVARACDHQLSLTSIMVLLRCKSAWEKFLIPAFVFFFQKLYPFRWINDPAHPTAGAAGGCILIRRTTLEKIGGMEVVRQALIDDCTLAKAVKATPGENRIWLGLSRSTQSLRPYDSLSSIWEMVARTAFTQLGYSPLLLLGTIIGMTLVYVIPPFTAIVGSLTGSWLLAAIGFVGWLLMSYAYWPMIQLYGCPFWLAACLPAIAVLYNLMTLDSAWRHWRGAGGTWKGRLYSERQVVGDRTE